MIEDHDPGGLVRLKLAEGVRGDALFSPCGRHRLLLGRTWVEHPKRWLLWIGMNPSTAGIHEDDPTVQRECARTQRLGYDGYLKANVLDYRATKPRQLTAAGVTANSRENHPAILRVAKICDAVVMAHGNLPIPLAGIARTLTEQLVRDGHRLLCLGYNRNGTPKHPLYLRADAELIAYRLDTGAATHTGLSESRSSDRLSEPV